MTTDDLYWAEDALDAYERLIAETKELLLDEKVVLDVPMAAAWFRWGAAPR